MCNADAPILRGGISFDPPTPVVKFVEGVKDIRDGD